MLTLFGGLMKKLIGDFDIDPNEITNELNCSIESFRWGVQEDQ